MRLSIQLSRQECEARDRALTTNPDKFTSALAEALWSDPSLSEMDAIEGIDLEDYKGEYLYTIVGEER